jgi:parallel beta-helix repeat protein
LELGVETLVPRAIDLRSLDGLSQSTFSGNSSDSNRGDGIHLVGATNNTLSHNAAQSNRNDGMTSI